ncbi:MAG: hypothetical protein R3242_00725 [Akkermansiaceae bacterium]|nr:hypothetical protein [Akkermansiaceae bacterium]
MQQTGFDRWLKEKFAYDTHIQVLRLPETMPRGVKVVELPDIPGRRFQYLLVVKKSKIANELFSILKDESMMYNTQIVTRDTWYRKFVAPEEKSVTWTIISWTIIAAMVTGAAIVIIDILRNPEFQKNLKEALEILKS